MNNIEKIIHDDNVLTPGLNVIVRWGYGLGFRVEGKGIITKVFEKSVRVKLEEDVIFGDKIGWHKGFELKGIPRYYNGFNDHWDYFNSIELR